MKKEILEDAKAIGIHCLRFDSDTGDNYEVRMESIEAPDILFETWHQARSDYDKKIDISIAEGNWPPKAPVSNGKFVEWLESQEKKEIQR